MFWLKLAWRNVFRNRKRSIISSIAIGIGLASLILMDSIIGGTKTNMVKSVTSSFIGQGQIHGEGYLVSRDVKDTVSDYSEVIKKLRSDSSIKSFAPRIISQGMVTSPSEANAVSVFGIDPGMEKGVSKVDDQIVEGEYESLNRQGTVLIGYKLAELLEVGIGDRVVITVPGKDGMSQEMLRVGGIFRFGIKEMDRMTAFISIDKLGEMLDVAGTVHEIAVQFKNIKYSEEFQKSFEKKYSGIGNSAVNWEVLMPQLKGMFQVLEISTWVMGLIIFVVVSFGIINTLLMSVYERFYEFGVLRAVGTRPMGLKRMIILEATLLGILSAFAGIILGSLAIYILSETGVDFRGIDMGGAAMQELLYPEFNLRQFSLYPVGVILLTLITGIYPAIVATKKSITDSMRQAA